MTLAQQCEAVGIEKQTGLVKQPFHIPVAFGLLDTEGNGVRLEQNGQPTDTVLLELTEDAQTWTFDNVPTRPTPSILRNFSAPVKINYAYTDTDLAHLSAFDTNAFTRWESGQELATRQILKMAQQWRDTGTAGHTDPIIQSAWQAMLVDPHIESGYRALALGLPVEQTISQQMSPIDPLSISYGRQALRRALAQNNAQALLAMYQDQTTPGAYSPTPGPIGRRALKNLALALLMTADHPEALVLAKQQYQHATNMTDRFAAFMALTHESQSIASTEVITHFYEIWQHDPLVIDKWFAAQASSPFATVAHIQGLMQHPAFTLRNPNRARALIFTFCAQNSRGFHAEDGSGYAFWADQVLEIDAINPEVAARLARAMDSWSRMTPEIGARMKAQLERVATEPGLSRNSLEIVSKALSL